MKRALTFGLGLLWIAFALGFGFFLLQYPTHRNSSGFPFFNLTLFDAGVLIGMAQFIGLCVAIVICFALGTHLCARAMVGENAEKKRAPESDS